MREWIRNNRRTALVLGGMFVSTAAWAFPWDIDLVDGVSSKSYEWKMRDVFPGRTASIDPAGGRRWMGGSVQRPSGAQSRPHEGGWYQDNYVASVDYAKSADLKNPFEVDAKLLAAGKRHYGVSCAPCHGMELEGGGPVTYNDPAKGIRRFPIRAPGFKGDAGVIGQKQLTDGQVYNRIRHGYWLNGELHMPAYGASLTERERWAVVAYLRTESGVSATAEPAPAEAAPAAAPSTETK
ncbi:MAG: hypothetical protein RLZZ299_3150 [Pseudomonadota bacterium]|jgi:mono/diheme cytochrome c family protein